MGVDLSLLVASFWVVSFVVNRLRSLCDFLWCMLMKMPGEDLDDACLAVMKNLNVSMVNFITSA